MARMRSKKWSLPWINNHPELVLQNPVRYKDNWKKQLHGQQLHLEIGSGKGAYLNKMAELYPSDAWIGLEREIPAIAMAARYSYEENPLSFNNKVFILGDAKQLEDWFDKGEVNYIHLNFSDPWPKKYTHKRRLSSDLFLSIYMHILADDGQIIMKTDNRSLFEDSLVYFSQAGFELQLVQLDYRKDEHLDDAITEYEQKFMDLNQPIYRCIVKK